MEVDAEACDCAADFCVQRSSAPSSTTAVHLRQMGVGKRPIFLTPYVIDNEALARTSDYTCAIENVMVSSRPCSCGLNIVLAGSDTLRPELEAARRSERFSGLVHFLGFVNQRQLPAIYAAADFLVLPSEYEPFGVASTKPSPRCGRHHSSSCGAARDLGAEGQKGLVFPVGDLVSLRSVSRTLAGSEGLTMEMDNRARLRIGEWSSYANAEAFAQACHTLELRRRRRTPTMARSASRIGRLRRTKPCPRAAVTF